MNLFSPLLGAAPALPDISPYLTKGSGGLGVTLRVGDVQTWLLIGGGVLLILGALALVKIMHTRLKFFSLEFGKGRFTTLLPYLVMGVLLFIVGGAASWLGWQALGYSVTLDATGLTEKSRSGQTHYIWEQAESASERIKSTEFWINFVRGDKSCRVMFQQRYLGEFLQDKAIQLTEEGLLHSKARRVQEG
ncbi:MAG: hypothetical protein ACO1TE_28515, partial [Prosthecobacter sp.]